MDFLTAMPLRYILLLSCYYLPRDMGRKPTQGRFIADSSSLRADDTASSRHHSTSTTLLSETFAFQMCRKHTLHTRFLRLQRCRIQTRITPPT
jgi:hypothetical protein